MTYVKSNSSTSAWGRLHYIFDEQAHDGSEHRVLAVEGSHLNLWRSSNGVPFNDQSGYYLNSQFKNVRNRAKNNNKRLQAQHLILSFSENEFSTNDSKSLFEKSKQVNQLVKGFMDENFKGSQWVSAIQCDGKGHKLHAHVLINTVKVSGKCVQTNDFTVSKLRNKWNQYMDSHYLAVTGRLYLKEPTKKQSVASGSSLKGWQKELKQKLEWARKTANSIEDYLSLLSQKDVNVKERNKKGDWTYQTKVDGKQKNVRDFYQRKDKKTNVVKSTRGMGIEYTPVKLKSYFSSKSRKLDTTKNIENSEVDNHEKTKRSRRINELERRRNTIRRLDEQQSESSNEAGYSKPGNRDYESAKQSQHSIDIER